MKKLYIYILIAIVLTGAFGSISSVYASTTNPTETCNDKNNPTNKPCVQPYVLLAPLPCETEKDAGCVGGKLTTFNPSQPNNLSAYLNLMIKIFIGLCAVLAVVMIVVGGIEYMTSELISSKESGKDRITHAILGLFIALGAYALLFTINPDLLKSDINPTDVTVKVNLPTPTIDVSLERDRLQSREETAAIQKEQTDALTSGDATRIFLAETTAKAQSALININKKALEINDLIVKNPRGISEKESQLKEAEAVLQQLVRATFASVNELNSRLQNTPREQQIEVQSKINEIRTKETGLYNSMTQRIKNTRDCIKRTSDYDTNFRPACIQR